MKKLMITVGNELMGDDAAGPLLARLLDNNPLSDWEVIDGGTTPESCLHYVRQIQPDLVLLVDAAEMGLEPGSIRLIPPSTIKDQLLFSTHTLPLTYMIMALKEFVPKVYLLGIQPRDVVFGLPVHLIVKHAILTVYEKLQTGSLDFETL